MCWRQWGLTERDLFADERPASKTHEARTYYDYLNEAGKLIYQAVRIPTAEGKTFRQRRPDGKGGWAWNLQGTRRVLYRLPELMAASPDRIVYIVEGEKDADNLRTIGEIATTNPQGAGKWRPEYAAPLRGRHVAILPDNDPPGAAHGAQVAQSLRGVAASVKVLELSGLPAKGDVSDWLAAGHTIEELRATVQAAPLYGAETAQPEEPETITLSTVEPRRIGWLWFGRLPSGEMGHASVTTTEHYAHLRADLFSEKAFDAVTVDLARPAGDVVSISRSSGPLGSTMGTAQEDNEERKLA